MPRYEDKALSFDVPRDWQDRSVAAFTAPTRCGAGPFANMAVTRDRLTPGEDIRCYADRQLVVLARSLDEFELRSRTEVDLSGKPAVELRVRWRGPSGNVEQRLLFVANAERTVFALSGTMDALESARLSPVFDRIFSSIKVHSS